MNQSKNLNYHIEEKDKFYVVGFKKRITLQFEGVNHEIDELYQKLTPEIINELKQHNDTTPQGMINVSCRFSDRTQEGSYLDQYIGVASSSPLNHYDVLEVEASTWAVFSVCGKFPEALQQTWADIYATWLPSSNYEITGGPEILWNEGSDMSKPDYKSEIWIPVTLKSNL